MKCHGKQGTGWEGITIQLSRVLQYHPDKTDYIYQSGLFASKAWGFDVLSRCNIAMTFHLHKYKKELIEGLSKHLSHPTTTALFSSCT